MVCEALFLFVLSPYDMSDQTGVELHEDVIEHCKASITKWKANTVEERDTISVIHFLDATADIQIIKGNGLNILKTKGESVVGFDRIYIGAAVDKDDLANITKLLSPGGILVGPGRFMWFIVDRVDYGNRSHDKTTHFHSSYQLTMNLSRSCVLGTSLLKWKVILRRELKGRNHL